MTTIVQNRANDVRILAYVKIYLGNFHIAAATTTTATKTNRNLQAEVFQHFCYFLILLYAAAAATVVAEKKLKISEIKIVRFPLS